MSFIENENEEIKNNNKSLDYDIKPLNSAQRLETIAE
jgi:hypothetical protein